MKLHPGLKVRTKCVVLSPHIDDVTFSLGAALLDNRFRNMMLVTIFSVSNCTVNDNDIDVARVTQMRKNEDDVFFNSIRAKIKRLYLDRFDAPLRLNIRDNFVFSIKPRKSDDREIEYLVAFLKDLVRDNTLLLAPLGIGEHIDHLIVQRAACLMMSAGCATAFYEDLPYAGAMPLSEIESIVETTRRFWDVDLLPCLIQSKSNSSNKVEAVSIYSSQIDSGTIAHIITHGERVGNGRITERLLCNYKALKLIQSALQ